MEEGKSYKNCPFCGEEILEAAIKCRYCLSFLDAFQNEGPEAGSPKVSETGESPGEKDAGLEGGAPKNSPASPRQNLSSGSTQPSGFQDLYPKADLGRRFLAWLLDGIIAGLGGIVIIPMVFMTVRVSGIVPGYLYGYYRSYHNFPFFLDGPRIAIFVLFVFAGLGWYLFYNLFKDGFGRGQSLGKRAAGLMVVRLQDNLPCTFGNSALRNVIKIALNLFPYFLSFLVEPILVLAQGKGQRLGDLAAQTQVINVEHYRS